VCLALERLHIVVFDRKIHALVGHKRTIRAF
jgi:hypothetical protein